MDAETAAINVRGVQDSLWHYVVTRLSVLILA
jgi:hypothetical protein